IHDVMSFHHLAENRMLSGEPFSGGHGDEKLRAIGVGTGVSHRKFSSFVESMGRALRLVFKLIARAAHAGADRVATLDHEIWDDPVKHSSVRQRVGTFLARSGMRPFAFALSEFDEVRHCFWSILFEQTANDCAFTGVKNGIRAGCTCHKPPSSFWK